jgi:hypothetical protein
MIATGKPRLKAMRMLQPLRPQLIEPRPANAQALLGAGRVNLATIKVRQRLPNDRGGHPMLDLTLFIPLSYPTPARQRVFSSASATLRLMKTRAPKVHF